MYSTTALAKNPKFTGRIMGTHQQLDQSARKVLTRYLPKGKYFPTAKDILHFEGARGPDGLKRKSPDDDDPSHMFDDEHKEDLKRQIFDHHYNLVQALKKKNQVRAAFEAAWLAHKVTDALTPAHHFPLSEAKDELMSNKEFVKIFGEPIKGIMHGNSFTETARNNWLYWGAGGHMSKHIAYEYGVTIIAAALPRKSLIPEMDRLEFSNVDPKKVLEDALSSMDIPSMYARFRNEGWTTELALETKNVLLPEIVRAIVLMWYSAAVEAYGLERKETRKKVHESK